MDNLNLDSILAAARAAKLEAGSGEWLVGERWMAHTVVSGPGQITSADDSPRALVSANSNFPSRAVLDHIAAAAPDTVIALVERLQRAEVERDQAQASLDYIEERDARVLRDLFDECAASRDAHSDAAEVLEQVATERNHAADLAEDLGAELDQLQVDIDEHLPEYRYDDGCGGTEPANHRETIEYAGQEIRRLRAGIDKRDAALDTCAARIGDLIASGRRFRVRLAAALGWEPGRTDFDEDDIIAAVEHREEARKERDALADAEVDTAALDVQTDLAVTLLEDAHERRLLLEHVRDELRRIAAAHPGPRVDLELLAVQVDVATGGER